jgi:hypothetical protein
LVESDQELSRNNGRKCRSLNIFRIAHYKLNPDSPRVPFRTEEENFRAEAHKHRPLWWIASRSAARMKLGKATGESIAVWLLLIRRAA